MVLMKKLLGILVLGLLWCNIVATEEIDSVEEIYRCDIESGVGHESRFVYIVKRLPNDNILVNRWNRYNEGSTEEWFNEIRFAHLNEGKYEWFEIGIQEKIKNLKKTEHNSLAHVTFYFADDALYNGQLALEVYKTKLSFFDKVKLNRLEKKANKAKHSDIGGEKHIKLENEYFESALITKKKLTKDVNNLLGRVFYVCKLNWKNEKK